MVAPSILLSYLCNEVVALSCLTSIISQSNRTWTRSHWSFSILSQTLAVRYTRVFAPYKISDRTETVHYYRLFSDLCKRSIIRNPPSLNLAVRYTTLTHPTGSAIALANHHWYWIDDGRGSGEGSGESSGRKGGDGAGGRKLSSSHNIVNLLVSREFVQIAFWIEEKFRTDGS
jgi:hypothetical protein